MTNLCIDNLQDIKVLLLQLEDEHYTFKSNFLYGASIGQHLRHILEFYERVFTLNECGIINYSKRERKKHLEYFRVSAIEFIDDLCDNMRNSEQKDRLLILTDDSIEGEKMITSFEREVFYCLEHSIHHQALIKVCLKEQNLEALVEPNFGLAYSTIQYQNSLCVQ
ncbi:hypothetical protein Emtol_0227 (plasmid) [Emticicia oligotrophica DSM 17448]|uniref:DinB family protein n=1 Tax=Emticicia oligotrophica (strain DSM 17448 / CIP 109782 / MTCC 6937 / GPTSA100-15) TaxID=929562 RepID=A0ABM5N7N2_EMTOG|nr:DinB family protein [Emticicia oligotrophica]AFK05499.1 hypothetical protein Emtol_0227 [Emticicia oligotrophica DSM 17448]